MLENRYPWGQCAIGMLSRDAKCWVHAVFQSREVILVDGRPKFFSFLSLSSEYLDGNHLGKNPILRDHHDSDQKVLFVPLRTG